jgi:beta-glucanase (GH16 family)
VNIGALHTEGGALIITQTQEPIHGLNFKSGMLQSWNKICFWGSMYIEGKRRRLFLMLYH